MHYYGLPSVNLSSLGCINKVVRCKRAEFLPIRDSDSERWWCGLQRANFQSRTCETIGQLRNHSDASARFYRRDEAGDAVVLLDYLRRAVQWCEQIGNPGLMLRIV